MIHSGKRCLVVLGAAFAVLAFVAGCASRMVAQQANPEYVGKSFKSVMVVAVSRDEVVRRTFEDQMVALLASRKVKGIPGYSVLPPARTKVEEAQLRAAIEKAGVDGVIITRVTRVDQSTTYVPGATIMVGYSGFYGYYGGAWGMAYAPPQTVTGQTWTASETRLFDAKNGTVAWTGVVDTGKVTDFSSALMNYIEMVFDAMVGDRVL